MPVTPAADTARTAWFTKQWRLLSKYCFLRCCFAARHTTRGLYRHILCGCTKERFCQTRVPLDPRCRGQTERCDGAATRAHDRGGYSAARPPFLETRLVEDCHATAGVPSRARRANTTNRKRSRRPLSPEAAFEPEEATLSPPMSAWPGMPAAAGGAASKCGSSCARPGRHRARQRVGFCGASAC